jgi:uncharacterized protein (DUF58 family)
MNQAETTRRQVRLGICREGWYYLIVLAFVFGGAMLRQINLLLVMAGMMAGPMLLSWRLIVLLQRGLQIRRKVPQGVCAGEPLTVGLQLSNTRRYGGSWAVNVEDCVARNAAETLRPQTYFDYVPAGQNRTKTYRGRLARRGRYRLGPLRISTRFPFGLIRRTVMLDQTDHLVVYPKLGRLTRQWLHRHHEALEGSQRQRRRVRAGAEGDFFGLREWRHGDNRRWIHWRSSARHETLVVRQFEQPRNRDVAVLLDLWRPDEPSDEALETVELAVSFAATVVADVCRRSGGELLLATTGDRHPPIRGPMSAALLHEAMQRLAIAEADHQHRLPEMLEAALGRVSPGMEPVLISTRSVDLAAPELAALWSDPHRRGLRRRIRCIDASGVQLQQYYQIG